MNIADVIRDGLRDPLGFFVLSYLLGAAMCGAWALAVEPLRWRADREGRRRCESGIALIGRRGRRG
jgi:hypothetical protein